MKKQTESFYIDLEKVDRVKAEKVINTAGGVWDVKFPLKMDSAFLYFISLDNTFLYRENKYDVGKEITSLSELKKQLGLVPDKFKIKVNPNQSIKVQELLFELGYRWACGNQLILRRYDKYLFLNPNGKITSCDSSFMFNTEFPLPEITYQDLFPDEITDEKDDLKKGFWIDESSKYTNDQLDEMVKSIDNLISKRNKVKPFFIDFNTYFSKYSKPEIKIDKETIKQLVINEPMKEKEYVLNKDIYLDGSINLTKGTELKFAYRLNEEAFFLTKSHDEDMPSHTSIIIPEKHVEEKQQLLSDVVTFGDRVLDKNGYEYGYILTTELKGVVLYCLRNKHIDYSNNTKEFDKNFKLKE